MTITSCKSHSQSIIRLSLSLNGSTLTSVGLCACVCVGYSCCRDLNLFTQSHRGNQLPFGDKSLVPMIPSFRGTGRHRYPLIIHAMSLPFGFTLWSTANTRLFVCFFFFCLAVICEKGLSCRGADGFSPNVKGQSRTNQRWGQRGTWIDFFSVTASCLSSYPRFLTSLNNVPAQGWVVMGMFPTRIETRKKKKNYNSTTLLFHWIRPPQMDWRKKVLFLWLTPHHSATSTTWLPCALSLPPESTQA